MSWEELANQIQSMNQRFSMIYHTVFLEKPAEDGTVPPLDIDVHLEEIAYNPCCDCFTGADLSALVREASVCALKQQMIMFSPANKNIFTGEIRVGKKHFEEAFKKVKSSITPKDQIMYEELRQSLNR